MLNIFAKRTKREQASDRHNQAVISSALHPSYYQGTVDDVTKAKRRAKNKVARKSRRANRR